MTTKQLQEKIEKNFSIIDTYLQKKYRRATTLERIEIRGVQKAIHNIVELEILLKRECDK